MKKTLSLILAIVLCLSLCACGGGEQNNATEGQTDAPSVQIPKELKEQISGGWAVVEPYDGAPQVIDVYEGIQLTLDDQKYEMIYEGNECFSVWMLEGEKTNIGTIKLRAEANGNIYLDFEICEFGTQPSFKSTYYKLGYDYKVNEEDLIAQNPVLPYVAGQMILYSGDSEIVPADILVNDDGTCIINDKELTWQVEGTDANGVLRLCVYEDETPKYRFVYSMADTGAVAMNLEDADGTTIGSYLSVDDYEIIEITADNWMEYYEFSYVQVVENNVFGERENWFVFPVMRLKQEYEDRFACTSSVLAIEFLFTEGTQGIIKDYENLTYTLTDEFSIINENTTEIVDLSSPLSYLGITSPSGAVLHYRHSIEWSDTINFYIKSWIATRATGTLYLYK